MSTPMPRAQAAPPSADMPGQAPAKSAALHPGDALHPTVRAYVNNPAIAEEYDAYFSSLPLFRYDCDFLLEHLPVPSRVLDLGCGTGRHVSFLTSLGCDVLGLDLSPHFLAEARDVLQANRCPVRLVQGDIHHPPLRPGARFDGILMMFSLLGLVRTHALRVHVLRTYARHLAPGGLLFGHVHNRYFGLSPLGRIGSALQDRLRAPPGGEPGDQVIRNYRGLQDLFLHCFTRHECLRLFSEAGLAPVRFLPLNARRDGPCTHAAPNRNANGFLFALRRTSPAGGARA